MWRDYTTDWYNNNENELISNINAASSTPNCSLDNNSSTIIGLRCMLAIIVIIVIAKPRIYCVTHFNSHELFSTFSLWKWILYKMCEYHFWGQLQTFILCNVHQSLHLNLLWRAYIYNILQYTLIYKNIYINNIK